MCTYIFKFDVVYIYSSPWWCYYYAVAALSELPVKEHIYIYTPYHKSNSTLAAPVLLWCCGYDVNGARSWCYGSRAMHICTCSLLLISECRVTVVGVYVIASFSLWYVLQLTFCCVFCHRDSFKAILRLMYNVAKVLDQWMPQSLHHYMPPEYTHVRTHARLVLGRCPITPVEGWTYKVSKEKWISPKVNSWTLKEHSSQNEYFKQMCFHIEISVYSALHTLVNIIHLWFRWSHAISIWITLPECLNQFRIDKPHTIHLISQCNPKQKSKH
jgi:hypothetical protein